MEGLQGDKYRDFRAFVNVENVGFDGTYHMIISIMYSHVCIERERERERDLSNCSCKV